MPKNQTQKREALKGRQSERGMLTFYFSYSSSLLSFSRCPLQTAITSSWLLEGEMKLASSIKAIAETSMTIIFNPGLYKVLPSPIAFFQVSAFSFLNWLVSVLSLINAQNIVILPKLKIYYCNKFKFLNQV